MTKQDIDKIMTQAQVFASSWALVDTRFDRGDCLAEAEQAKAELREMLESLKDEHSNFFRG